MRASEIVRDEEFKSGQLDTGFISRFNEHREAASKEPDQEEWDMAMIAAAIHYVALRKHAAGGHPAQQSRWKMSGRKSLLDGRNVMKVDKRIKK